MEVIVYGCYCLVLWVKIPAENILNFFLIFPIKHDLTFPNPVFLEIIINLLSAELAQRVAKVNPSLAKHDMPCLRKQCRSRSVGF